MLCVGDKGREIYSAWELGAEEAKKIDTYYTKYEEYVKLKSNRVVARYKFHQKFQQEGELFEQFLTDLKLLVKDCDYVDPGEMVRNRWNDSKPAESSLDAMLPKQEEDWFRKVQILPLKEPPTLLQVMKCQKYSWKGWHAKTRLLIVKISENKNLGVLQRNTRSRSVTNMGIDMTIKNVSPKESDAISAESWTISPGFANLSHMLTKEYV